MKHVFRVAAGGRHCSGHARSHDARRQIRAHANLKLLEKYILVIDFRHLIDGTIVFSLNFCYCVRQGSLKHQHAMASTEELACVYSALILQDGQSEITAEKINNLIKTAGLQVEPYWAGLFAKALESINLKDLVSNIGSGAGAAAAVAPAAGGAAAEEEKKEEKEEKKEEEDEEDDDMGFGLFD